MSNNKHKIFTIIVLFSAVFLILLLGLIIPSITKKIALKEYRSEVCDT